MLSRSLLEKLKAMGRGRIGDGVRPGGELNEAGGQTAAPSRSALRALDDLVRGTVTNTGAGTCYVIEKEIADFWPDADGFVRRYLDVVGGARARFRERHVDDTLRNLVGKDPSGAVHFDIETCGFAGTPVFLIGLLGVQDGRMTARQLLARDYGEEAAILARFAQDISAAHTLISFNGRTFDWPFLADRAALHRVPLRPRPHADLLPQARRSFGRVVPDHKLQTLELFLCNRRRTGDIPGSAIPAAYHDFVRTGHATQLRDILQHNLLDLVTMAELVTFILADEFPVRT